MIERLTNCKIAVIIFHNETSGYTVTKCTRGSSYITVVGCMNEPRIGNTFDFTGEWKDNPKYGRQFVFTSFEEILPQTEEGIMKYLGSGLIKGVGPELARKIIDTLGSDTLNIIDNNPERLLEVKGIGPKKLAKIQESWEKYRKIQNIMIFLKSHDISTSLAMKIYEEYGDESINVMKENPYKLTEIEGVGFLSADGAARKMGFSLEDKRRIFSGIFYTMQTFERDGHCFAFKPQFLKAASEILEVSQSLIESRLYEMIDDKEIIRDEDDALYRKIMFRTESGVARKLRALANYQSLSKYIYTEQDVRTELNGGYVKGYKLDQNQINAILTAINNKVSVITGGPGTGKTTTIEGIIELYRGQKILLAAPTGRASKKLHDTTGMNASTIHRLLGFTPAGCNRNERNPLEGHLLIVDECSMIDIYLMYHLVKAIPLGMSVVFVGDVDQLPSIGPGRVFADIIESGIIKVTRLNTIHRQEEGSIIAENAKRINAGDMPFLHSDSDRSEFYFTEIQDPEVAAEFIVRKYKELSSQSNAPDVQILSPMRRGIIGINNLNILLQEAMNPVRYENLDPYNKYPLLIRRGDTEYRLGDKVMQIRNNYEESVFNGDIGIVSAINREENELTVSFEDNTRNIKYEYDDLEDLVLAYAITIHKSQGSEYDTVILPIMMSQFIMLQRNLLYTAITRAKKKLIMTGESKAVYVAVKNNKISERNTRLVERLRDTSDDPDYDYYAVLDDLNWEDVEDDDDDY